MTSWQFMNGVRHRWWGPQTIRFYAFVGSQRLPPDPQLPHTSSHLLLGLKKVCTNQFNIKSVTVYVLLLNRSGSQMIAKIFWFLTHISTCFVSTCLSRVYICPRMSKIKRGKSDILWLRKQSLQILYQLPKINQTAHLFPNADVV